MDRAAGWLIACQVPANLAPAQGLSTWRHQANTRLAFLSYTAIKITTLRNFFERNRFEVIIEGEENETRFGTSLHCCYIALFALNSARFSSLFFFSLLPPLFDSNAASKRRKEKEREREKRKTIRYGNNRIFNGWKQRHCANHGFNPSFLIHLFPVNHLFARSFSLSTGASIGANLLFDRRATLSRLISEREATPLLPTDPTRSIKHSCRWPRARVPTPWKYRPIKCTDLPLLHPSTLVPPLLWRDRTSRLPTIIFSKSASPNFSKIVSSLYIRASMIRFSFPLISIFFSSARHQFLAVLWAPLELTDRFSSSGELVASASHSRDDLGVILKIVDRRRERDGRGRRGEERMDGKRETRECEERRGVNSRPLGHTRGKTERARQLVLVYGSQNRT